MEEKLKTLLSFMAKKLEENDGTINADFFVDEVGKLIPGIDKDRVWGIIAYGESCQSMFDKIMALK